MLLYDQEHTMCYKYLFISCLSILAACSSSKDIATKNTFAFTFEGGSYQIVSLNTPTGEGSNYLFELMDNGNASRTASDLDQDGSLDIVIHPEYSLDVANRIYIAGILKAKSAGNFKEREHNRTFEYRTTDSLFTIRSYTMNDGTVNNLFTVSTAIENDESMFTDNRADGQLNRRDKGVVELTDAAPLYTRTLQKGILSQRITEQDGVFVVNKTDMTITQASRNSDPLP